MCKCAILCDRELERAWFKGYIAAFDTCHCGKRKERKVLVVARKRRAWVDGRKGGCPDRMDDDSCRGENAGGGGERDCGGGGGCVRWIGGAARQPGTASESATIDGGTGCSTSCLAYAMMSAMLTAENGSTKEITKNA